MQPTAQAVGRETQTWPSPVGAKETAFGVKMNEWDGNQQHAGNGAHEARHLWKITLSTRIYPVIIGDTICGVSLLTGPIG
jgi:hypothetical protein